MKKPHRKTTNTNIFYVLIDQETGLFLQKRSFNQETYMQVKLTDMIGKARIFTSEELAISAIYKINDNNYELNAVPMLAVPLTE